MFVVSDNLYGFRWPPSSPSPTPSDIPAVVPVTDPLRHQGETSQISCVVAQIGYVVAKWPFMFSLHLRVAYVLPECWLISVPANFRRSICPFLAKVMPDFSVNSGMTCARICRKYRVPRICVLSILVVVFDRFSINVLTMNIGNVWRRKGFRYLQILRRRARPVRRNLPRWW